MEQLITFWITLAAIVLLLMTGFGRGCAMEAMVVMTESKAVPK